MSYKVTLDEFDKEISLRIDDITSRIDEITFNSDDGYSYVVHNEFDCATLLPTQKKQGVYFFELNLESEGLRGVNNFAKVENFVENWIDKETVPSYSPSVIYKRLQSHNNFDRQWLPIYIGKSKDVYKRIKEHIDLSAEKKTYAMKLKHRINLSGMEFRISIIEIDVKNYDFIVPYIERSLREKYKPLIGKQ